jgi:iron complex transport system substrate-binding protein
MDREGDLSVANDELFALPALLPTPAGQNRAILRMDGLFLLGFGPRAGEAALELHNALYGAGE